MRKNQVLPLKDILVLLSGFFGGLATIALVLFFNEVIKLIWENLFGIDTTDPSRSLAAPCLVILAGLIVGLITKYFGGVIGGLEEIIAKIGRKGSISWRDAPRTLLISLISVASGASLGPEAPSTVASTGASSWLADKTGSELKVKKSMGIASLIGMIGGFFVLVSHSSEGSFGLPETIPELSSLPLGLLFGIGGALMAVLVGFIMSILEPIFARFDKAPIKRAFIGSSAVALMVFIAPLTMFSGQYVLPDLVASAGSMSFLALLGLALAKLLSTNLLLRSGFFGGPIFPAIFAGSSAGLALSYLLTGSVAITVAASLAGLLTIVLEKPVIAGLLAMAFTGTMALPSVILGIAGGMLVRSIVQKYGLPNAYNTSN